MQDFNITVSKSTGEVWLNQYTIGRDSENLQKNFVFGFSDEFVNGQARLEMSIDGQDSWITLTKDDDNETYYVPIQSAVTKCGKIFMQLVITEGEIEEGIPIFKSNVFYVFVDESINAEIEQPEEYPTWIEIANEKLNEMDNLDIEATKEDDTTTIIITKKDGTEESVEVKDGETGPQGETGPAGQDAKINGLNTLNIVAGNNIEIEQEDNTMTISSTGGGGGASEYVVRLTKENDEITSDKTISEIITAYNDGNIVKGVLTDTEAGVDFNLQLLIAFEDSDFGLVQFATVYDSGDDFKSITIIGTLENNEDSWQYLDREMAYTAGTGIEITNGNVINNTAPNKIISITADPQTMELDKTAGEINALIEQGYLVLLMGRLMFIEEYDSSHNKLYAYFYSGGFATKFTITGNQVTDYESLDVVYDNHYTHTDNNYTNAEKTKLAGLENKIITLEVDQSTMQFDKTADEVNEYLNNGYIVMALGYQVFRRDYNASTHTIRLAIFFGSFGQVITVVGNQLTGVSEYFYVSDEHYVHTDNNFSSYYKDKLDTTAEIAQSNTGLVNGGQVYDALQGAGGGGNAFYLGNVSDYTQQNPLDLDKLELGLYAFTPAGSSNTIYAKATNNGQNVTGSLTANGSDKPRILYLEITNKVKNMTLTTSFQTFGYFYIDSFNESAKRLEYKAQGVVAYLSNNTPYVASNSSANKTTFNLVTTGGTQTITAKKTFSVLPESSVVPTTDDQLVNKKYVDDNAGGGDNGFVNVAPHYFSSLTKDDIQSIIDNMLVNNTDIAYLKTPRSGYRTGDIVVASLSDTLSSSTTSYVLNAWKIGLNNDPKTQGIGHSKLAYSVTISWNDNIPTVTSTSQSGTMNSNTIYLNGYTSSWTPSTNYSPVHKKYVDDSIATAITTTLGGSY